MVLQTRRLGRTGHHSTLAILGSAAVANVPQASADAAMQFVLSAGINHIDVAPTYGAAEERLRPWMARERQRFFLGCKTAERTREAALAELQRSRQRLGVDAFDLYQLHKVATQAALDAATAPGGALEALVAAREQGWTRFLGITSHGMQAPSLLLEALRRFAFDTVLFPLSLVLCADPGYRAAAEELLEQCQARDVGVIVIKSAARGPWGDRARTHNTWYQPFADPEDLQRAVDFSLSQRITGLCSPADLQLLPLFVQACLRFRPMSVPAQKELLQSAKAYEPISIWP